MGSELLSLLCTFETSTKYIKVSFDSDVFRMPKRSTEKFPVFTKRDKKGPDNIIFLKEICHVSNWLIQQGSVEWNSTVS